MDSQINRWDDAQILNRWDDAQILNRWDDAQILVIGGMMHRY